MGRGLGVASLILSIIAVLTFWFWYISVVLAILAIVFAIIQNKKEKTGLATAGLIIGIIALVVVIIYIIMILVVFLKVRNAIAAAKGLSIVASLI